MAAHAQDSGLSRRRLVQGIAVAAGSIGVAASARATGGAEERIEPGMRLLITGRAFRAGVPGAVAGRLPDPGSVPSTTGTLLLDGQVVGAFASAGVPGSGGRFVLHSFELGLGTILGMGSGGLDEGAFAVVGGTGRYAGARGSYTARQAPSNLGGDGTAEFVLDLVDFVALEG